MEKGKEGKKSLQMSDVDVISELCCTSLFLMWMLEKGRGRNKDMEERE